MDTVDFAFEPVPGVADPFAAYGLKKPANLNLLPISRTLPWPLHKLKARSQHCFVRRLLKTLDTARPDIVLVRHIKLACALHQARPDLPLAYEAHEVFADTTESRRPTRTAATEACAVLGARLLLANSAATAARLAERYPTAQTAVVVPNGVRLPDAQPAKDWSRISQEIIYTGSLFGWKGVDDLVAAAAHLPGCRITIVGGSAADIEKLRQKTPAAGAEVVFTGHLPHEEVQQRLAAACIAVLPNRADPDSAFTSPLKLFEYLATGCAVVSSDLPSIREILGEVDAAWAMPGNATSLAAAISSLVRDPGRAAAMATSGFARVQPHSWAARSRRLSGLLQDAAR
jgi:glycosyltransferase involved in cell wall biosynthesis